MRRRGLDRWYPALLLAVAAQRGGELLLSRRNERRAGVVLGTAGARSYPAMVALHVCLFLLPLLERRRTCRRPPPIVSLSGWTLELLATLLRLWVIRTLGAGWNVRARVPAALHVVDTGPYRYVRHPNYLAVAIEMAALPLAGGAYLSALGLSLGNLIVLTPRVREEEALLSRIPAYRERMAGKPRCVPHLSRPPRRDPPQHVDGPST